MYDQSFKNQAVKECVNGQPLSETSRKYGIILGAEMSEKEEAVVKESVVVLNSVNIAVDGYDITISKRDVVRLMEVFYHFDKKEGKRDDV